MMVFKCFTANCKSCVGKALLDHMKDSAFFFTYYLYSFSVSDMAGFCVTCCLKVSQRGCSWLDCSAKGCMGGSLPALVST